MTSSRPGDSSPPVPMLRVATAPLALPSGMRDMLPPRSTRRRALARAVLEGFQRRGYDPVVPPVFEREEVVTRGLGARAGGDLVRLLDPDTGEVMVLRPDMTPQIARIIATRFRDVPPPIRLAYEGSVIRRPRGRARRHRQVAQAGIECVGWATTEADLEVISAVSETLARVGLGGSEYIELSHPAIVRTALEEVPAGLRDDVSDALAVGDVTTWQRLLAELPRAAKTLGVVVGLAGDASILERAETALPEPAFAHALRELRAVVEDLCARGARDRVLVDLGDVRGMGYYTGVRFQIMVPGVGEPVASGGRYDELLARYGAPMPATGCAIDLEALEEALEQCVAPFPKEEPMRWVIAGKAAHRRERATRARADGVVVAELDVDDITTATAWARAHGYSRVWMCDGDGATECSVAG